MSMMSEISSYCSKYSIDEEGQKELLNLLNRSLSMISSEILNKEKKEVKEVKIEGSKKYKSRKAEEYAEEHGLNLSDFSINEVSKKDVENKVREMTKLKKDNKLEKKEISKEISKESSKESSKEIKKSKERVICSGINKKGEACKSVGTIQPEGAKKKYCFRHAEDFGSFECDTDSSDEEDEEKEEEKCLEVEEEKSLEEEKEKVEEELKEEE